MRKYNLKCFGCGEKFKDNTEVYRTREMFWKGMPLCCECYNDAMMDIEDSYYEDYMYSKYGYGE